MSNSLESCCCCCFLLFDAIAIAIAIAIFNGTSIQWDVFLWSNVCANPYLKFHQQQHHWKIQFHLLCSVSFYFCKKIIECIKVTLNLKFYTIAMPMRIRMHFEHFHVMDSKLMFHLKWSLVSSTNDTNRPFTNLVHCINLLLDVHQCHFIINRFVQTQKIHFAFDSSSHSSCTRASVSLERLEMVFTWPVHSDLTSKKKRNY